MPRSWGFLDRKGAAGDRAPLPTLVSLCGPQPPGPLQPPFCFCDLNPKGPAASVMGARGALCSLPHTPRVWGQPGGRPLFSPLGPHTLSPGLEALMKGSFSFHYAGDKFCVQ